MNGLLDFLSDKDEQRKMLSALASTLNRGMVANTLGAPVDTVAMMLRPFGYNNPAPVGGSEWFGGLLEKGGFVDRERRPVAETLAGLLTPAATQAAAKVGAALENAAAVAARNAQTPRRLNPQAGVIVFHGSPYKFDKFDSSKIGTGEGAQAYGHGLYFAESPDVAKSYRFAGQPGYIGQQTHGIAAAALRAANGDKKKALDLLNEQAMAAAPNARQPYWDAMNNFDDLVQPKSGVLYKVDLPDEAVAKMLDWDKPLSEQSEAVRSALEAIEDPMFRAWQKNGAWPYVHGETLYRHLAGGLTRGAHEAGKHVGASQQLRSAGIPGIRYLDGGSRGAGQGTYNYVVFPGEEGLLSILGRE